MRLLFGPAQARGDLSNFREHLKNGRPLLNPPNEMVPTTAQNVEGFDSVFLQNPLNGLLDWMLNRKRPFWIDERLGRIVEVNVFDIEIGDQSLAVPERPADFKTAVQ